MRQCKVACNGTNSAAVDHEGTLYVWGAARYCLLGQHMKDNLCYYVPKPLILQKDKNSQELDAFTNKNKNTRFKVKDIAMGSRHMVAIAVDAETHREFTQLDYAMEIFSTTKKYLVNTLFKKIDTQRKRDKKFPSEVDMIDVTLEYIFSDDEALWPFGLWERFHNLLFKDCKLPYSDNIGMSIDALQKELASPDDENLINLKELRDLIVGKRTNHGIVFAWGLNDERLGTDTNSRKKQTDREHFEKPKIIKFDNDPAVIKVVCGDTYTLCLTENGNVYSWGKGIAGSLGLGAQEENWVITKPHKIIFPYEDLVGGKKTKDHKNRGHGEEGGSKIKIVAIASGHSHCLALTNTGAVFSWGNGQGGRLGHGDLVGKNTPEQIKHLADEKVEQIVCGAAHSGAITDKGKLYIWGVGKDGRLGLGVIEDRSIPTTHMDFVQLKIRSAFFGMFTSFVVTRSDVCYGWGRGSDGNLGIQNAEEKQPSPRKIYTLTSERIQEFAVSPFHTLALTSDGRMFAFGNSKDGKLGLQTDKLQLNYASSSKVEMPNLLTEAPIFHCSNTEQVFQKYKKFSAYTDVGTLAEDPEFANNLRVIQVICAVKNTYFLMSNGQVYAVGGNERWQCSDLENKEGMMLIDEEILAQQKVVKNSFIPPQAAKLIEEYQARQAIQSPQVVHIIGKNSKHEETIKHISCGSSHVLATSFNGHVFSWGNNEYGQLGLGKEAPAIERPSLVQELADKKIKMTAAGANHSLFLAELGQIYSAGFNEFGQLGVETQNVKTDEILEGMGDKDIKGMMDNFLYIKSKGTPVRIFTLENIRFIAAGESHSLAISDANSGDNPSHALYTWGWGAYGQLGHSKIQNAYNLSKPKHVKFREARDTKIAYVSAGSKHTLCLDVNGKLWYFGSKEAVGIFQNQNNLQFEPIQLNAESKVQQQSFEKGFTLVDAGDTENLIISADDQQVYKFGKRIMEDQLLLKQERRAYAWENDAEEAGLLDYEDTSKVHLTTFKDIPMKASYVSSGIQHMMLIDKESYIPHSIGSNANYRAGQKDPNMLIELPKKIKTFQKLFDQANIANKKIQNFYNLAHKQNQSSIIKDTKQIVQKGKRPLKYPIQYSLKFENHISIKTDELIKQDTQLQLQFNKMVTEFHHILKGIDQGVQSQLSRAQDGFITRVYNFPTKIALQKQIESSIPKSIIRNRQLFEAIYTYLQAHPCYLINWIVKTRFFEEPTELKLLLQAIFGRREMHDNLRVINTLLVIAKSIFQHEMKRSNDNIKDMTSVFRTDSPFKTIFSLIFDSQSANQAFNQKIITKIIHVIHEMCDYGTTKFKDGDTLSSENMDRLLLSTLEYIRKTIEDSFDTDYAPAVAASQSNKSSLTIQVLSILNFVYNELYAKATDAHRERSGNFGKLEQGNIQESQGNGPQEEAQNLGSEEPLEKQNIKDLKFIDPEAESELQKDIEMIKPYLLDLLFDKLIKTLQGLTFNQIKLDYWGYDLFPKGPPPEIFDQRGVNSIIQQLTNYLQLYFRSQFLDVPHNLQNLLKTGKKSAGQSKEASHGMDPEEINFRDEIAKVLFYQPGFSPLDLDFLLVKQLFNTSLELSDPVISATVSDIIYIHNTLVDQKYKIAIQGHQYDPIALLINDLGGKKINSRFPTETLRARLNLKISCRFLLQFSQIVKCSDCHAPVTHQMIPPSRFNLAYHGRQWICSNDFCQKTNKAGVYQCANCQRSIPADHLANDLVFRRFRYEQPDPNVMLFRDVLSSLPLVEENGDLKELLEAEIEIYDENKDKANAGLGVAAAQADIHQQSKLYQFKQVLDDYIFRNKNKSILQVQKIAFGGKLKVDDQHKLAGLLTQNNFLDQLNSKTVDEIEVKRKHHELIGNYQAALSQIYHLKETIKQRSVMACQELDQILINSYSGLSSEFLKARLKKINGLQEQVEEDEFSQSNKTKFQDKIWAGRLHLNEKQEKQRQATTMSGKDPKKQKSDKLQDYFREIGDELANEYGYQGPRTQAGDDEEEIDEEAKVFQEQVLGQAMQGSMRKAERSLVGTFKYTNLQQSGVIKKADSIKYDFQVLRDSQFVFNDDGKGGFHVELIYKEPPKLNIQLVRRKEEVVLESFDISREILAEMRRNFACHSIIIFGQTQFRVFELVKTLNQVVCQNNIFTEVQASRSEGPEKMGRNQDAAVKEREGKAQNKRIGEVTGEDMDSDENPEAMLLEGSDKKHKSKGKDKKKKKKSKKKEDI